MDCAFRRATPFGHFVARGEGSRPRTCPTSRQGWSVPVHGQADLLFIPPLDGEGGEPGRRSGSPGGVSASPTPTPRKASSDLPTRGRYEKRVAARIWHGFSPISASLPAKAGVQRAQRKSMDAGLRRYDARAVEAGEGHHWIAGTSPAMTKEKNVVTSKDTQRAFHLSPAGRGRAAATSVAAARVRGCRRGALMMSFLLRPPSLSLPLKGGGESMQRRARQVSGTVFCRSRRHPGESRGPARAAQEHGYRFAPV